ncbi:HNH endonuclease [Pelagibacterium lentulum]|uniref:HNH domain-containing protein n=1 Tax=Pelagibacterium lentulum TaxID=2029865 RepID=A0A916RNG2_9HYPH|nr:HNH endonuclease [Pelagibacterium lentulum]GGA63801.1 hypothetical protein GCM10011499_37730 [Pelagibacterium lentulum]
MGKLKSMGGRIPSLAPRLKLPPKIADPFYHSHEWRQLMAELYRERGRFCEDCGRGHGRLFGDHVKEIKDGGDKLDKRNVRILCGICHARKTAKARAARAAGQSPR